STALAGLAAVLGLAPAPPAAAADEVLVRARNVLGPYFDVQLAGKTAHRLLVPASEVCQRLTRPEARVRFVGRGFPGWLEPAGGGDERCEAAGVFDLERFRDRRPRPKTPFSPRETAVWETFHRDGRHALLRGRFLLAHLVGMAGGHDLVAVVADDAACADVVAGTRGALEFRDVGAAFRLSAGDARCPVLGFARPLPSTLPR
ncbi:MAG: hypothetical protein HKP30_15820, partial [Myxococcales bacterium]|nr:hypothetical protein [Myxococcales bacterium]